MLQHVPIFLPLIIATNSIGNAQNFTIENGKEQSSLVSYSLLPDGRTALAIKGPDYNNHYFFKESIVDEVIGYHYNDTSINLHVENIGNGIWKTTRINVGYYFDLDTLAIYHTRNNKLHGSYINYQLKDTQRFVNGVLQCDSSRIVKTFVPNTEHKVIELSEGRLLRKTYVPTKGILNEVRTGNVCQYVKHGVQRTLNAQTGELYKELTFKNDTLDGRYIRYFRGRIAQLGYYAMGKRHGLWEQFYRNTIQELWSYNNDSLVYHKRFVEPHLGFYNITIKTVIDSLTNSYFNLYYRVEGETDTIFKYGRYSGVNGRFEFHLSNQLDTIWHLKIDQNGEGFINRHDKHSNKWVLADSIFPLPSTYPQIKLPKRKSLEDVKLQRKYKLDGSIYWEGPVLKNGYYSYNKLENNIAFDTNFNLDYVVNRGELYVPDTFSDYHIMDGERLIESFTFEKGEKRSYYPTGELVFIHSDNSSGKGWAYFSPAGTLLSYSSEVKHFYKDSLLILVTAINYDSTNGFQYDTTWYSNQNNVRYSVKRSFRQKGSTVIHRTGSYATEIISYYDTIGGQIQRVQRRNKSVLKSQISYDTLGNVITNIVVPGHTVISVLSPTLLEVKELPKNINTPIKKKQLIEILNNSGDWNIAYFNASDFKYQTDLYRNGIKKRTLYYQE